MAQRGRCFFGAGIRCSIARKISAKPARRSITIQPPMEAAATPSRPEACRGLRVRRAMELKTTRLGDRLLVDGDVVTVALEART